MSTNFRDNYSSLTDEELLCIAGDKQNLVDEAALAADAEIRKRGLNYEQAREFKNEMDAARSDEIEKVVSPFDKPNGPLRAYWAFVICPPIIAAYLFLLPSKFKFPAEWNEPALMALIGCTILFLSFRPLWKRLSFWLALIISTVVQVYVAHSWLLHYPVRNGYERKGVGLGSMLAGFLVGAAVFSLCKFVSPYGEANQR